jgi:Icc-related predicted phosphoesterase
MLKVIQNIILRSIYDGGTYTSNTSFHVALGVRALNEEIKRASAKLYQRIGKHDKPIIAALGNYDIHMH